MAKPYLMMLKNNSEDKREKDKKNKILGKGLFAKFFAFENNIDITCDEQVLKRKNEVIKNIIFVINILIFLMMSLYSAATNQFQTKALKIVNWVITAATFPLTFIINFFLKKLIKKSRESDQKYNLAKQHIAMYFAIGYLLLLVSLFYIKINFPSKYTNLPENYKRFAELFSYLLFYVVVIICALYQDKRFLFNMILVIFSALTLLHFFITYNTISIFQNEKVEIKKIVITDIFLRTFVYFIFSIIIYATTTISNYMQLERKKEVVKRMEKEEDYKEVSGIIIDLIKTSPKHFFIREDTENILKISNHLASIIGFDKYDHEYLKRYSIVHFEINNLSNYNFEYESLKDKMRVFLQVIKRIQLFNKSEMILRFYNEKRLTQEFIKNQNQIQRNLISDCILISEIYYRLRSPQDYKAPLRHIDAMNVLNNDLKLLFNLSMLNKFNEFSKDFDLIYQNLK